MANPVTGTASFSVPLAAAPGRSAFGSELSLPYDSGAGNGPFGLGMRLSTGSFTRRTDRGIPQYRDAEESEVFGLAGAEDLVPVLRQNPDGSWAVHVVRRARRPELADLSAIIATLDRFLWPVLQAAARGEPWPQIWSNGAWKKL